MNTNPESTTAKPSKVQRHAGEIQLTLFTPTLAQQFDTWVHTPEGGKVANLFIRLAIGFKRRGIKVGARMIWERLRWMAYVRKKGPGDVFSYNDHYPPYLARHAMDRVRELAGYFETREVGKERTKRRVIVIEQRAVASPRAA